MNTLLDLISQLQRLPGFGPRSASRLAYYLTRRPEHAFTLGLLLQKLKSEVKTCSICGNFTNRSVCNICDNLHRDQFTIAVVEGVEDLEAIEQIKKFTGVYHVLDGVLEPQRGVNAENLKIVQLVNRLEGLVKEAPAKRQIEVIIATNPTTEGETTALYLTKLIRGKFGDRVKLTRLAKGIPTGADLEYVDNATLTQALEGRKTI